jgi:hypothetical protein
MTDAEKRAILVRSKARKFAAMVKESQMAWTIPDEIFDWLTDAEIETFKTYCIQFGLVQRASDWKFERK